MKRLVENFVKKSIVFKDLSTVDKSLLKTRKKIDIFSGTDVEKNYHSIFVINQKSRFLIKNAEELIALNDNLQQLENHNFRYKHLIINGAICSKSINFLKETGWKIHDDFM